MADALIENPILNSPFLEPERHFKGGKHSPILCPELEAAP